MFKVFKRKPWTPDGKPSFSRGRCVKYTETEEGAQAFCADKNARRPAYGTKAYFKFANHEYTKVR